MLLALLAQAAAGAAPAAQAALAASSRRNASSNEKRLRKRLIQMGWQLWHSRVLLGVDSVPRQAAHCRVVSCCAPLTTVHSAPAAEPSRSVHNNPLDILI